MEDKGAAMASRVLRGKKKPPKGYYEHLSDRLEEFERDMKDAVNEDSVGKRRTESLWPIHKVHWKKNRFIYEMRFIEKKISKELYDFLVRERIADGALIAKWRKPGYEKLCSLTAIRGRDHNFGTTSMCRVPLDKREGILQADVQTGCICCASNVPGAPIWWDEYDKAKETREMMILKKKRGRPDVGDAGDDDDMNPEVLERLRRLQEDSKDAASDSAPAPKYFNDGDDIDADVLERAKRLRH